MDGRREGLCTGVPVRLNHAFTLISALFSVLAAALCRLLHCAEFGLPGNNAFTEYRPGQAANGRVFMIKLLAHHARVLKFLFVGGTCFTLQFILLTGTVHLGLARPVANSLSFAISAQLNFFLSSKLTWGDRPAGSWRQTGVRLLAYNGTALLALGTDTIVFLFTYREIGTLFGAALGVVVSTCLVYLVCNQVVFRRSHGRTPGPALAGSPEYGPEAARVAAPAPAPGVAP
jgi:putative flippase GtrA